MSARWLGGLVSAGCMLASLGAAAAELRVGISTDNPPWSFVPERMANLEAGRTQPPATPAQVKALRGLDVDVAMALARRMGSSFVPVPASWIRIEQELLDKRFDVILSSWTPSRRTPPSIVATEPYYHWGLVICVRATDDAVHSLADLKHLDAVGHYQDPAVEQTLRSLGAKTAKSFDSEFRLFAALGKGELGAVVHDSTFVRWQTNRNAGLRVVGEPLNRLGYHAGVRSEDAAFLGGVQAALKALVASPEMKAIRDKWEAFGRP